MKHTPVDRNVTAQIRDGATEYQGEIEDATTNYSINRTYFWHLRYD